MRTVTVGVLGPLDLRVDDEQVHVGGHRQRTILATLAMSPGRVVSVDELIDAVWPATPPATARTQIAICVVSLRKALQQHAADRDVLATSSPGYQLRIDPGQVDVTRFVDGFAAATERAQHGEVSAAVDEVSRALAVWRGPALTGLSCHPLELEAARLDELRLTAVEHRAEWCLRIGRHSDVINELSTVVPQHPLRELARSHLMLAQYRAGLRTEALATYREGRRISVEEFGLEPGPLTRQLHEAILRDDPGLAADDTSPDGATVVPPAQLPAEAARFLGRDADLLALDTLLDEPGAGRDGPPVAYLTGAQGIGKTALAVHWARRVAGRFPDGQLYVDLAGANGDLLGTCLRSLGVAGQDVPAEPAERQMLYRSILSDRRVLIVLDGACAVDEVRDLLPGAPSCCVVVTSREVLYGLLGGHCTLHLPLGALTENESVELLGSIAGRERVAVDRPAAGRLAGLCDGLPLALRIIGARLAARPRWTVRHLAERMADESRRLDELSTVDHDMRACLAETCGSLTVPEAELLRAIGGLPDDVITLPVCAALLGTTPARAEVTMERLVDRALAEPVDGVTGSATSYRVSGLLRVYVRELAA